VEVRACGTSLSERGATPRSKTKEQTGKFTAPILSGCLSSHGKDTCRSRLWNATRSHKLLLHLRSIRRADTKHSSAATEARSLLLNS
jgi:hypothetical protein